MAAREPREWPGKFLRQGSGLIRSLRWPHRDSGVAARLGLLATLVVVLIAAALLQRTASTASSINDKAKTIALTGRGINTSTDSIIQLNRTNELAASILRSAAPLEGELAEIVSLAGSVDGLAGTINNSAKGINGSAQSINGSALSINHTATRINDTAGGINTQAAGILAVAQSINRGVAQINSDLDATIAIASSIRSDTRNLVLQALRAKVKTACIDRGLMGSAGTNGDCK